jgi:anthranilate phosphoribosyltransferase
MKGERMSEIKKSFERLFDGEMEFDEAREFLISLYEKGESADEIAAAAEVMRSRSIMLPLDEETRKKSIDIVGTGGDRSGSFNISTTVSLLLSSIGSTVVKHGNRSITSKSGAADLLEALGIDLSMDVEKQKRLLEETGWCFIFAMNHHPAMKHIMPVRKSIEHRTIFNILGPLTNPAGAQKYLMGVFSPDYIERMAEALLKTGARKAFVVSSLDGMDEIGLSSPTEYAKLENSTITTGTIYPEEHGFERAPIEAILGGDAKMNAQILREIFDGKERGPKRDIVLLNASYALVADGRARDIREGVEMALDAIESSASSKHLERIVELSHKL